MYMILTDRKGWWNLKICCLTIWSLPREKIMHILYKYLNVLLSCVGLFFQCPHYIILLHISVCYWDCGWRSSQTLLMVFNIKIPLALTTYRPQTTTHELREVQCVSVGIDSKCSYYKCRWGGEHVSPVAEETNNHITKGQRCCNSTYLFLSSEEASMSLNSPAMWTIP